MICTGEHRRAQGVWASCVGLGIAAALLFSCAGAAQALTCPSMTFGASVKAAKIIVFGEVVATQDRSATIAVHKVLEGAAALAGLGKLRLHRNSRYVYLPPKGTLLLLYLEPKDVVRGKDKALADVPSPPLCNGMTVLRVGR